MAVTITQTANPTGVITTSLVATYSGVSIGPEEVNRMIVVACSGRDVNPASATIDYGSGDVAMNATTAVENLVEARIFYLMTPTGETATFKITFEFDDIDGTQNHIVVYSVAGTSTPLLSSGTDSSSSVNSDPLTTGSITIPLNGGFLASAGIRGSSTSSTWGNATEDTDATTTFYRYSTAFRTTSGTATVTDTGSSSTRAVMAWVVFNPSVATNINAGLSGEGNLSVNTISLNQQISARFEGAGNLRGALTSTHDQFTSMELNGTGNLRVNVAHYKLAFATFGGDGNFSVDAAMLKGIRATLGGAGFFRVNTTQISAPLPPEPPDLTLVVGEWPLALPQCPILNGFSEQRQRNIIEFQSEIGTTKLHRRATASVVETSLTFRMTDAEVEIFNEWYIDYQDDGTVEFIWEHPITKSTHSWMFDPQEAPRIDRMTPDTFRVSFNLLRLD